MRECILVCFSSEIVLIGILFSKEQRTILRVKIRSVKTLKIPTVKRLGGSQYSHIKVLFTAVDNEMKAKIFDVLIAEILNNHTVANVPASNNSQICD